MAAFVKTLTDFGERPRPRFAVNAARPSSGELNCLSTNNVVGRLVYYNERSITRKWQPPSIDVDCQLMGATSPVIATPRP